MRLFKYLHPDRIDVIKGKQISFSPPQNLNDPFELKPPIHEGEFLKLARDYSREELDKLTDKKIRETYTPQEIKSLGRDRIAHIKFQYRKCLMAAAKHYLPDINSALHNATQRSVGVLCLSEKQDDILMWAHYTNAHEGFVLEFDPGNSFFDSRRSKNDECRYLRKMIYSDQRPLLSHKSTADMSAFLTKSTHWEYEREWRMMVDINDSTDTIVMPHQKIHLFAFPSEAIISITIGCRASEKTIKEIYSTLANDEDLKKVPVFQASADKLQFRLNITEAIRP